MFTHMPATKAWERTQVVEGRGINWTTHSIIAPAGDVIESVPLKCHPPAINYPHSDLLVGRAHWVVNEFIAYCSQGVKIDCCLCR